MTARKDLKSIIRDRQKKTGESYTAAHAHVMRDRAALLGLNAAPVRDTAPRPSAAPMPEAAPIVDAAPMPNATAVPDAAPARVEAIVIKVNEQSARVRILGEEGTVTFRSGDLQGRMQVVPGHVVTLVIQRRWAFQGNPYASGRIENPRIDVPKLGLTALPLKGGELEDVAKYSEPYRRPDPYAPLWKKLTAKPRPSFMFDPIAWGALPGLDSEDNPTCDAAELAEAGDEEGARVLLMKTLGTDLRCLDAHAHLGNLIFDRLPEHAIIHYEMGIRIGELSLPPGFDGLLVWGRIYNRPFLRCLHGYGLCLWRLGRVAEAQQVFERILSLNPNDNQGVRACWDDVRRGRSWDQESARDQGSPAGRAQA